MIVKKNHTSTTLHISRYEALEMIRHLANAVASADKNDTGSFSEPAIDESDFPSPGVITFVVSKTILLTTWKGKVTK